MRIDRSAMERARYEVEHAGAGRLLFDARPERNSMCMSNGALRQRGGTPSRGALVESSDDLDTVGTLFGVYGDYIAQDDNGAMGANFRIEQSLGEGTYYVRVHSRASKDRRLPSRPAGRRSSRRWKRRPRQHRLDCDRVVRGGAWSYRPQDLRSAHRNRTDARNRSDYTGFRVVRTLTP